MLTAQWEMQGVVTETRRLTSQKSKDWEGFVAKVATLGSTFEIQLNKDQFSQLAQGQQVHMNGKFEDQRGNLRLILEQLKIANKNGP